MSGIDDILYKLTFRLKNIPSIEGIVLGGSRARGTYGPESDIDIGIYYNGSNSLDLEAINLAVKELDDKHRDDLVTSPGSWGEWVNGGGRLSIGNYPIDLILRDVNRVKEIICDCKNGIIHAHYQTGHPHAYINAMYMGELGICKVLWDNGRISALKSETDIYPEMMKEALIHFFTFEAEFSHMFIVNNSSKDDLYYIVAHQVRCISCLNQVIFALNEQYCLNEKKAVKMIETFAIKPENYKTRVENVFKLSGSDLFAASIILGNLVEDVNKLVHL